MLLHIRFADIPPVPWKNGAGTTHELFRREASDGSILIRISLAEIEGSQAFSKFAGLERIIMQLDGPDMDLIVDGKASRLKHETPFAFSGDSETSSIIHGEGKAHDMNLMCARRAFQPQMEVKHVAAGEHAIPHGFMAIFALTTCRVLEIELGRFDLLIASGKVTFETTGQVAILSAVAVQ